jgi:hypothetical protein
MAGQVFLQPWVYRTKNNTARDHSLKLGKLKGFNFNRKKRGTYPQTGALQTPAEKSKRIKNRK